MCQLVPWFHGYPLVPWVSVAHTIQVIKKRLLQISMMVGITRTYSRVFQVNQCRHQGLEGKPLRSPQNGLEQIYHLVLKNPYGTWVWFQPYGNRLVFIGEHGEQVRNSSVPRDTSAYSRVIIWSIPRITRVIESIPRKTRVILSIPRKTRVIQCTPNTVSPRIQVKQGIIIRMNVGTAGIPIVPQNRGSQRIIIRMNVGTVVQHMDTGGTPIVYRPSLLQKKTKAYTLSRLKTPVCSGFPWILMRLRGYAFLQSYRVKVPFKFLRFLGILGTILGTQVGASRGVTPSFPAFPRKTHESPLNLHNLLYPRDHLPLSQVNPSKSKNKMKFHNFIWHKRLQKLSMYTYVCVCSN